MKHLISLGAGVQSSTVALMASKGLIEPMPTAAIFADTQDEPASVMRWLDWLEPQLTFPVVRVTKGSLSKDSLRTRLSKGGDRYARRLIPAYVTQPDTSPKMLGRSCTADYKLTQILAVCREIATVPRGCKVPMVTNWIGISTDEAHRAFKPPPKPWVLNRYPLIELGMNRSDCLDWMNQNGYPEPPKSACYYCPFHNDAEWLRLRDNEPEEFAKAVEFDKALRAVHDADERTNTLNGRVFLHRQCVPLDQVKFKHDGQGAFDLWGSECEGLCGI